MDHVDYYCERLAPGLWAEPVNAVTNGAFLIAGALLFGVLARERSRAPVSVWLLPAMTVVVGLCSLAFHTLATGFTGLLDTASIAVFILVAATVTVHQIWAVPWRWAWLVVPGYLAVSLGLTGVVSALGVPSVLGGYLSALLVLVGFGAAIRTTAPPDVRRFGTVLLWTAALFAVSLTLRTLDGPLCSAVPVGTHFLWHCLNATVLYLVGYTVIRCWRVQVTRA